MSSSGELVWIVEEMHWEEGEVSPHTHKNRDDEKEDIVHFVSRVIPYGSLDSYGFLWSKTLLVWHRVHFVIRVGKWPSG